MAQNDSVEVKVQGPVDWLSAQDLSARIRAAMRNAIPSIVLHFDRSAQISSAEFLAFLTVAAGELRLQGRHLIIRGATGKNRSLLEISRLKHLLDDAPAPTAALAKEN